MAFAWRGHTVSDIPAGSPMQRPTRAGLLVSLVLLLALCIRGWGLPTQSLTMDELAELQSASGGIHEILHTRDGFPPLHGLLLHLWLSVFPGDVSARWLSVAAAVLTVAAMWRLGVRIGGERAGLFAALALALSPFHVWFSQEVRAYSLYFLFAVVALWLFFRAMSSDRMPDWMLYALACIAGMYAHYFFALLPITAGMIILFEKRRARDLARASVGYAAIAIGIIPLVGLLREDLAYQASYRLEAPFSLVTTGYTYFSAAAGFTVGPSLRELHSLPATQAIRMVLPWGIIVAVALAILGYMAVATLPRVIAIRLIVLTTAPVLIGGIVSEFLGVGFRVRYFAWVAAPLLALLGAGLASSRFRTPRLVAAVALLSVWTIAIVNRQTNERYWNEDVHALARFLRSTSSASVPVFVMSDYMAIPVEYYLGAGWTVCALPSLTSGSHDTTGPLRVIATHAPAESDFWLVYTRPFHSDPDGRVPLDFVAAGLMKERAHFAGADLYEGRTRPRDRTLAPLACQPPNPMPQMVSLARTR